MSVLRLLTQRPQLFIEHGDAYSELIGQEILRASSTLSSRLLFGVLTIFLFGIAGILAGVALMLWTTQTPMQIQAPWLLWLVPTIPFILALICLKKVRNYLKIGVFFDLRKQIATDIAVFREASASA